MSIDNGNAAFPGQAYGTDGLPMSEAEPGMTLRDWFAGQTLIGLCQADMGEEQFTVSPDLLARTAYSMADAMLAERSKS